VNIDSIQKLALSLPEKPERREAARKHFDANGLNGVTFLTSIHGEKFGLKTIYPYAVDQRDNTFFCGHHEVSIFLSHYVAWQIAALGYQPVLVLEDDAQLEPGWKESADAALRDVPGDFSFLFLGHCGAAGAMKNQVKGNVWRIKGGVSCFHAYVITPKGAQTLMDKMRKIFGPVDLLTFVEDPNGGSDSPFKYMNVFCAIPRKISQFNTRIPD